MIRVFNAVANDVRKLIVLLVILAVPFAALGVGLTATSVFAEHDEDSAVVHACYIPGKSYMRYVDDPAACFPYESVVDLTAAGAAAPVNGWERISVDKQVVAGTSSSEFAICSPGKKLLGGGVITAPLPIGNILLGSGPSPANSDTTWAGAVTNNFGTDVVMTVTAFCANVSP